MCLQKAVLALTKKYAIECVRDSIGKWIATEIAKERERRKLQPRKYVNPVVGKSGTHLFSLIVLGAQFELESVYDACVEYFKQVLICPSCSYDMNEKKKYTGRQLADLIEQLKKEGCDAWAVNLSVNIIGGLMLIEGGSYYY